MQLRESIEKLKNFGYKVLNEEMYEKEYMEQLRTRILNFAKEVDFTVDPELLETVMFEAYSHDMDLDQAFKAVWKAVYVEDGASTVVEIE